MTAAPGPAPSGAVRPADRYGDIRSPARRRLALLAGALLLLAGLGWVVWAGLGVAQRDVRWNDVGYSVVDDTTVEVTFSVVKDPGATVTCTVQALNGRYAQVGLAEVEVGPAEQRAVRRTVTVRTAERAVTGVVDTCTPG
jgi:hypothetical protein